MSAARTVATLALLRLCDSAILHSTGGYRWLVWNFSGGIASRLDRFLSWDLGGGLEERGFL